MMATVPHVISGLGLRKFQADGFLLTRVYTCLFNFVHNYKTAPVFEMQFRKLFLTYIQVKYAVFIVTVVSGTVTFVLTMKEYKRCRCLAPLNFHLF